VQETFDGIGLRVWCSYVDRAVYDAVTADSKDLDKFESTAIDERPERRVCRRDNWCGGCHSCLRRSYRRGRRAVGAKDEGR